MNWTVSASLIIWCCVPPSAPFLLRTSSIRIAPTDQSRPAFTFSSPTFFAPSSPHHLFQSTVPNDYVTNNLDDGNQREDTQLEFVAQTLKQAIVESNGAPTMDENSLEFQWKPQKLIVTVTNEDVALEDDTDDESTTSCSMSLTGIARKIQKILAVSEDDDEEDPLIQQYREKLRSNVSPPLLEQLDDVYTIEVTTPGASNMLTTDRMYQAYRGFDVSVVYWDESKEVESTIPSCRLLERTDTHLIVQRHDGKKNNSRRLKIPREHVRACQLPKAKTEK